MSLMCYYVIIILDVKSRIGKTVRYNKINSIDIREY